MRTDDEQDLTRSGHPSPSEPLPHAPATEMASDTPQCPHCFAPKVPFCITHGDPLVCLSCEAEEDARAEWQRKPPDGECEGYGFGFHWRDNIYFKRGRDGVVEVRQVRTTTGGPAVADTWTIPASEWASIVAFVSVMGEVGNQWQRALAFHNGTAIETDDQPPSGASGSVPSEAP